MEKPITSSKSITSPLDCCRKSGMVNGAKRIPSPNHDQRPDNSVLDVLVVHAISLPPQCYGNRYVEDLFTNQLDADADPYFRDLAVQKLSSHFYIKRSGELIQFVATHRRAWHAGKASFKGRQQVNDFSIGVELEGCDEDEFENRQYAVLAALTRCLQIAYPAMTADNIVGHSDIAPGRKTDPGACFDWQRYFKSI